VEDSSNEAGGDDETHDKPNHKEARSKKKHDHRERKVDGGSNEAGGDDQILDRPSPKEVRSKKKDDCRGRKVDDGSNEDDGRPSAYAATPDDDASLRR
jgi:hypothetical protein